MQNWHRYVSLEDLAYLARWVRFDLRRSMPVSPQRNETVRISFWKADSDLVKGAGWLFAKQ